MMRSHTMPIDHIPDWEERLARQDAFWQCEKIDRPVAQITLPKRNPDYPWPKSKTYASERERWTDSEYLAECALAWVMNTDWLGDSLPCTWPNLGPEVFSAFFGCELEYTATTSWSVPIIHEWSDVDKVRFSEDNSYWKKIEEMTDALLVVGRNRFYTGITDLHPGGDAIAAFRDPAQLNVDLIESPAEVKSLLSRVTDTFLQVYDHYYSKLTAAGQAISAWCGIVSTRKWYVPSNDFSCMISKKMFDEVFLPGIRQECRHLEASIYHLDGPGALRHLDSLLDIEELNAIQWVYGEGNGRETDWLHVYKRCQAGGKGLQMGVEAGDLDFWMGNLRPEGLWLTINGVRDRDHAEAVLRKMRTWK